MACTKGLCKSHLKLNSTCEHVSDICTPTSWHLCLVWRVAGLFTRNKVVIVDFRVKDNLVRDRHERKRYEHARALVFSNKDI